MTNDFRPKKAGVNQPKLSKEEYAEKKKAEKERVYQIVDDTAPNPGRKAVERVGIRSVHEVVMMTAYLAVFE